MVNTYHKQKGHKFLTNLTNSEHLAFLYSDHNKERAQQIKLMQKRGMIMRRKSSLWKTTAVSLSAMMTLSMGAAVLAAGTEQTTHESQTEDNTENNSADTDEVSNTSETQTEECKIELSDDGILVDGEAISENPEDSVYAGADIVYYKEGQDSTYGAGDEDDGHSEEEASEHTVITITKAVYDKFVKHTNIIHFSLYFFPVQAPVLPAGSGRRSQK